MIPEQLDWRFPFCPQPPAWTLDWDGIERALPEIRALADCPQDPRWHAEGNVGTHTRMVCEQLVELDRWRSLTEVERQIVFCAALFHDVAKPLITRMEDGRWRAPKHAAKGALLARRLLYRDWLPTQSLEHLQAREQIVNLILRHGVPLWNLEIENPVREVISLSQTVRCDLLALVAEADVLGRDCTDRAELLERVELFREQCREQQCERAPRRFASAATRQFYLQGGAIDPDVPLPSRPRCEVVMLAGLPGAGKDTWIAAHGGGRPVVSLDDIRRETGVEPTDNQGRVAAAGREAAREFLRTSTSFIWNATNVTRRMRQPLLGLFADYDAAVRIVYVETTWQTLVDRSRTREIPLAVLEKLLGKLEVPALGEAHDVNWVVNG